MNRRLLALALIGVSACRSAPQAPAPDLFPKASDTLVAACGPFGKPAKTRPLGSTHLILRPGFVLEHSDARRIPVWVAEHLVAGALATVPEYHRPRWRPDPELPPAGRAEDEDYRALGPGYDRGHMAPAADFASRELRDATFVLSNAVPQDRQNNRTLWATLERKTRAWVEARDEAWVVTGAFSRGKHTSTPAGVEVPTHLFKAILARRGGRFEAIAFVVENRTYAEPWDLAELVTSIDAVEAATGLDLFPGLPAPLDRVLESSSSALWKD